MALRVAFVHGRPAPHPFHGALARAVEAEFHVVDPLLRWHDRPRTRGYRYLSWLVNALSFPRPHVYDVILSEGLHVPPVLMRSLGRLRPQQTLVALLDNELLYFLASERYGRMTGRVLLAALRRYDAVICVGSMQTELARQLLGGQGKGPLILTVPSALSLERWSAYSRLRPHLTSHRVLFIANGPSGWRGWYKGIDVLFRVMECLVGRCADVRLALVGEWDVPYLKGVLGSRRDLPQWLDFVGPQADLTAALTDAALYVHLGRGEAFGISVLEAMAAGLPAVVSSLTGAREAVAAVDSRLVVPLEVDRVADTISWYLNDPLSLRQQLSERARAAAAPYQEARATALFRAAVQQAATAKGSSCVLSDG